MARVNLEVPFSDKEAAKRLGARWDATERVWYVPDHLDPLAFSRWLPPANDVNLRADHYFIASALRACWRCGALGPVHGFMLPAGHETLVPGDAPGEDAWQDSDEPSLPCAIDFLAPGVAARMQQRTRCYRMGYSREAAGFCWMNFCEHCGAKFSDDDLFGEPGQGLLPLTPEDAARITLLRVDEPFAANAGSYSIGVPHFEALRRL